MVYFQLICLIFIIIGSCIATYYNIKALVIVSQCRKIMRDIEKKERETGCLDIRRKSRIR